MAQVTKIDFDGLIKRLRGKKKELPTILANETINYFKQSFKNQGWENSPWKSRQTPSWGRSRGSRAILVQSGKLRRSFKVMRKNQRFIEIANTKPYASIHNQGGKISITSKQRGYFFFKSNEARKKGRKEEARFWANMAQANQITIPKRQFMGRSRKLNTILKKKIASKLKEAFK